MWRWQRETQWTVVVTKAVITAMVALVAVVVVVVLGAAVVEAPAMATKNETAFN